MQQCGFVLAIDRQNCLKLMSLIADDEGGTPTEIQIPAEEGITGQFTASQSKKTLDETGDLCNHLSLLVESGIPQTSRYPIHNRLVFPLLNQQGNLVAIIELLNKIKFTHVSQASLSERIDSKGFTAVDEALLEQRADTILPILEGFQSFYQEIKTIQRQRAIEVLWSALNSISQSSCNPKEILQKVMEAAQKLTNSDRSTLWLVDRERGDLWTELPAVGEWRCEIGIGFAGQVAQSREPMIIPFDLYDHPIAGNAKKTDKETGYRTCSLLCMPVLNPDGKLLGVTQLVNKRKLGDFPEYNPADWPQAPEQFKASFNERDRRYMEIFNNQVGVVLRNAQQQDILLNEISGRLSNSSQPPVLPTEK
jgi:hypothetical protein